jgi:hypothetical protein
MADRAWAKVVPRGTGRFCGLISRELLSLLLGDWLVEAV